MTPSLRRRAPHQLRPFQRSADIDGELLGRALVAGYGPTIGMELHADAMANARRTRGRAASSSHPVSDVWRRIESDMKQRAYSVSFDAVAKAPLSPTMGRDLQLGLEALTVRERVAALLVHSHNVSPAVVASLMSITSAEVDGLVTQAIGRLRVAMA